MKLWSDHLAGLRVFRKNEQWNKEGQSKKLYKNRGNACWQKKTILDLGIPACPPGPPPSQIKRKSSDFVTKYK